jgi:Flp pilus assembly protein TadB
MEKFGIYLAMTLAALGIWSLYVSLLAVATVCFILALAGAVVAIRMKDRMTTKVEERNEKRP